MSETDMYERAADWICKGGTPKEIRPVVHAAVVDVLRAEIQPHVERLEKEIARLKTTLGATKELKEKLLIASTIKITDLQAQLAAANALYAAVEADLLSTSKACIELKRERDAANDALARAHLLERRKEREVVSPDGSQWWVSPNERWASNRRAPKQESAPCPDCHQIVTNLPSEMSTEALQAGAAAEVMGVVHCPHHAALIEAGKRYEARWKPLQESTHERMYCEDCKRVMLPAEPETPGEPTVHVPVMVFCPEHLALIEAGRKALALRDAVRSLMQWGVDFDDQRLGYITVQVDRRDIEQCKSLLAEVPR